MKKTPLATLVFLIGITAFAFVLARQVGDSIRRNPEAALESVGSLLPTVPGASPAPYLATEETPRELVLAEAAVRVPFVLRAEAGAVVGKRLRIPKGWSISVYAAGIPKARMLAKDDMGTIYVTAIAGGTVLALPDRDHDGIAEMETVASELRYPSGLIWNDGDLYVGEEGKVTRLTLSAGTRESLAAALPEGGFSAEERATVVGSLRAGGNHTTRTLAIRGDKLYVSVGSSCNACEDDPDRAAVLEFNLDGTGERLYARGLRNSVGLIVGPDGELWATDNGRDLLGDDIPPEEVNVIRDGADYGWPYCYGDRVQDPEWGSKTRCADTTPPTIAFQAHSAPLGLRFLGDGWPAAVRGSLLVASHGSWNRSTPTGYKLFRMVRGDDGWRVLDFVTGWRTGGEDAWGRPVDMIEGGPGELYISDDKAGVVYLLKAPS